MDLTDELNTTKVANYQKSYLHHLFTTLPIQILYGYVSLVAKFVSKLIELFYC